MNTRELIFDYYACFNRGDYNGMLDLLGDEVVHEPSQGQPRIGKVLFSEFLSHMERCYKEQVVDPVVMVSDDERNAAAEFMLVGSYLNTDGNLPQATGQQYRLRVGAFFELENGFIQRVSNHYNLRDWLQQVTAGQQDSRTAGQQVTA
jgi:steroid delta-isomerase-like uncharacterized protein